MTELPPVRPTKLTLHLESEDLGEPGAFDMLLQIARDIGLKVFRFPKRVEFVGPAEPIKHLADSFDAVGWKRHVQWN